MGGRIQRYASPKMNLARAETTEKGRRWGQAAMAVVAGALRGSAPVRGQDCMLRCDRLDLGHTNRAAHQPGVGFAGVAGARRDPTGCSHRWIVQRRPHACSATGQPVPFRAAVVAGSFSAHLGRHPVR